MSDDGIFFWNHKYFIEFKDILNEPEVVHTLRPNDVNVNPV